MTSIKFNSEIFFLKSLLATIFTILVMAGFLTKNFFTPLLVNQIILIAFVLFFFRLNIWSLTSQFHIFNLFYQILPYLLNIEIYFTHVLIIYIIQITSILSLEKIDIKTPQFIISKLKKYDKIELKFFILLFLLILNYILNFKFALQIDFAILVLMTYLVVTRKKNSYINLLLILIFIFYTFKSGFLGGDRRFLIFYLLLFFIFFIHNYKIKIGNAALIFTFPLTILLFYFQGLFRVFGFDEGVERFMRLNLTTLYNFLENIDIGVFSRIYESMFVNDLYIHIKNSYITGLSFERMFYLFVPRNVWPEKPQNLAYIAGEYAYKGNSAPISLPLEIYVNFTIWLAPIAFFILTKLLFYCDKTYNNASSYFIAYYFFFVSFFIVIYRGSFETDLMIFTAFLILVFFIFQFTYWLVYKSHKKV
jgi:hypothetical protein